MSEPVAQDPAAEAPWLVVVDPQVIFADPASEWASPEFDDAMAAIERVAHAFGDRVLLTRWLPTAARTTAEGLPTSWAGYFEQWAFADRPAADPLYDLVPRARQLTGRPTVDLPTFGKWGEGLRAVVGEAPHLVLAGVSTDCCVITTALAAADGGAHVQVLTDGCAGSTAEDGAAALRIMGLFDPQIRLTDSFRLTDSLRLGTHQ
ncbi:MAG TPA: cysteine hydrolase [Candidatus Brevibacterium intestinigallinarum]|nr:cysteine hydrolase [Candidatus Brevibacterium intestinigallinarum]